MKKIIFRMSPDKKSLFLKASNAILNKTAIINLETNSLINFLVEKENSKSVLSIQTDSSLIELMHFNTIEEAVDVKKFIESKIYKKNVFNDIYSFIKKLTITAVCLSFLVGAPFYTYFKINQISEFNKLMASERNKKNNQGDNEINDMQKKVTELTSKPTLTPEENKQLDNIQKKLENVNIPSSENSDNDDFSKIQNRLLELSQKPRDALTEEDKKEVMGIQKKLLEMDKNNVLSSPKKDEADKEAEQQKHLNNMLDEIKEKSFK